MSESKVTLSFEDVAKKFQRTWVLKDLSFRLEAGRFYALLGKNGAGKSTLLHIASGLEPFDEGSAHALGQNLDHDAWKVRKDVFYVSESVDYQVWAPTQAVVDQLRHLYPRWNEKKFHQLATEFGVPLQKRFSQLSRGQKMQFAASLGIATEPKLLLLDELTAVLDAGARRILLREITELQQKGSTVVLATNLVSEVFPFATDLLLLSKGQLQVSGRTSELSSRFQKITVSNRLQAPDHPDCREIRMNPDQSFTWLVPREAREQVSLQDQSNWDDSPVTPEEVFIYYTQEAA